MRKIERKVEKMIEKKGDLKSVNNLKSKFNFLTKNKKVSLLVFFGFFILVCALGFYFFDSGNVGKKGDSEIKQVCIEDITGCFNVSIADSPFKRQIGLMFRDTLAQNEGMFFVFDEPGQYGFWMKNTYFPLDIIWIDENMRVVFIAKNVQPCLETEQEDKECETYSPDRYAKYVLELNSGLSDKFGITVGKKVTFD